jgi:hypothetical protein
MKDYPKQSWAALYANQDFIVLNAKSGNGISLHDPLGKTISLNTNADNNSLGEALTTCLKSSRFIDPKEDPNFFDIRGRAVPDYQKWVESLMKEHGYKTKSRLFKKMIHCSIEEIDGVITIAPMRHVKMEAWDGDEEDMPLETISRYNSPEEIGAALRRAMEKCIP